MVVLLVVRGRIDWFSLISAPYSQQNFKKERIPMSKYTVDIVDNEYSSNAKTVAGNTLQVPKGLIVRNNSSSVEIGIVGIKGTVMVYKDNPRQSMDLPVKPSQISWTTCGAQSIEAAALFAKALNFAVKISNEIERIKKEVSCTKS